MEALEAQQETRKKNDTAEPCEKRRGPHRKPRIRVVSSRFMSPIIPSSSLDRPGSLKCPIPKHASSSSSLEIHPRRSQSALRRQVSTLYPNTDDDDAGDGDDDDDDARSEMVAVKHEGAGSINRPLQPASNVVHYHAPPFASRNGLQQGSRRGAKPLKENGDLTENSGPPDGNGKLMGTVSLKHSTANRTLRTIVSSQNLLRPNGHGVVSASTTTAARLVQSNGLVPGRNEAPEDGLNAETVQGKSATKAVISSDTIRDQGVICDSPPVPVHTGKGRATPGLGSSMPESDMLPTISRKPLVEMSRSSSDGDSFGDPCYKAAPPLCCRSLNSTLLSCQQSPFGDIPTKSVSKLIVTSKCHLTPIKTSSIYLPPHPSNAKSASVMKSGYQGDVHSLRLLHNLHLQWRFANAKAEAAMNAQRIAAERSLHCLWVKISEMQQAVTRKRTAIEKFKDSTRLCGVLDGQMQYLDAWNDLQEEYIFSLSEAIKALQDATVRLPIDGVIRVDYTTLQQALSMGTDTLEATFSYMQNFLPLVEGISSHASTLASMVSWEKAMMEDCGALLSIAHALLIQECSLRSHLVQLNKGRGLSSQPQELQE